MGLHYLHGFKVVMLDLKSPNVLLAADGTAKLADVGLARLMTGLGSPRSPARSQGPQLPMTAKQ